MCIYSKKNIEFFIYKENFYAICNYFGNEDIKKFNLIYNKFIFNIMVFNINVFSFSIKNKFVY